MVVVDEQGHVAVPTIDGAAFPVTEIQEGYHTTKVTCSDRYNSCSAVPLNPPLSIMSPMQYDGDIPTVEMSFVFTSCSDDEQMWRFGLTDGTFSGLTFEMAFGDGLSEFFIDYE